MNPENPYEPPRCIASPSAELVEFVRTREPLVSQEHTNTYAIEMSNLAGFPIEMAEYLLASIEPVVNDPVAIFGGSEPGDIIYSGCPGAPFVNAQNNVTGCCLLVSCRINSNDSKITIFTFDLITENTIEKGTPKDSDLTGERLWPPQ